MSLNLPITVRPLLEFSDLTLLHDIQQRVWGMPPLLVIPNHFLLLVAGTGGQILGAFDSNNELIGFSLAIVSRDDDGEVYLSSHMLAVDPRYQSQSVGFTLKLEQRVRAIEAGYSRICWTFDPMESKNANLNIRKLGGRIREYKRNYYGKLDTALAKGLPSDRYLLTLDLRRPPRSESSVSPVSYALRLIQEHDSLPFPQVPGLGPSIAAPVAVQVPANFQQIKSLDMDRALQWLLAVRDVSERLFAAGFEVSGFNYLPELQAAEYVFSPQEKP